jgi:hypothetical protein
MDGLAVLGKEGEQAMVLLSFRSSVMYERLQKIPLIKVYCRFVHSAMLLLPLFFIIYV